MPWFAAVIPALGALGAGAAGAVGTGLGAGLGALGSGLAGATASLGPLASIGGALGSGLTGLGSALGTVGSGLGAVGSGLGSAAGALSGLGGSAAAAPSLLSLAQPASSLASFNPATVGLSNAPLSTLAGPGSLSSGMFASSGPAATAGSTNLLSGLGKMMGNFVKGPFGQMAASSLLGGGQQGGPPPVLPIPQRPLLIDPRLFESFLRR